MDDRVINIISSIFHDARIRYTVAAGGTALAILTAWAARDLQRWRSFDTGGTPPTVAGYWRMTKFRIQRLFFGGNLSHHWFLRHDGEKYLRDSIPPRQGPRPTSREWTLPQRQEIAPIYPVVHKRIHSRTEKYASANKDFLEHRLSKTEGSSAMAVYARSGGSARNSEARDMLLGDEIFHSHPEDSSLHVWLSEADCKEVVSRGWGERFPLSAVGLIHQGFTFIYAPRTMEECDVVEEIIRAGIEYVTGQKPAQGE